ncbi:MAG: 3-deoxy-8-phosphooctulonate synthase [Elusimicrobia bacterium]|nr:3-deoxy-8-phosphooctulonate synthase [Elusimicrobiota bacterium]
MPLKMRSVKVGDVLFSNRSPLVFVGGTCALESESLLLRVGRHLRDIARKSGFAFVLKCSYDKANRTSLKSFRGPGLEKGLQILARVKEKLQVPLLTDVHETWQAEPVARVADILQIPAFLCRQTDLLLACGRTQKTVNIKKGQFMTPWQMKHAIDKVRSTGNRRILLTERGSSFGYGNLVVDMRSLEIMKGFGTPVIYDCTHSVQLPGALGGATGGQQQFIRPLARAATALGISGIFFETHPEPGRALSDGTNAIPMNEVQTLVRDLRSIDGIVKSFAKGAAAPLAHPGPRPRAGGTGRMKPQSGVSSTAKGAVS